MTDEHTKPESPDALLDFVASVSGERYLRVEEDLGDGFVRLKVSEAERRQAKHDIRSVEDVVIELLRNARDAHAQRIFVATTREGDTRTLVLIDDGIGIPEQLRDQVFEPRVTSKLETMVVDTWGVHGRGMALFSVRSNVVSAEIVNTGMHRGTAIRVVTDPALLVERTDQSSWPECSLEENGVLRCARGPHNIIRRVVEFACEHPGIDVCLGTPTEILATMHDLAREQLDPSELLFCDDPGRLPLWQRPATASDAAELVSTADALGLAVSERTAHRILGGEIAPLRGATDRYVASPTNVPEPSPPNIYRDRRGLKLHEGDLDAFRRGLEDAFDTLADRYYLQLRGEPKIVVGRDEIRVVFRVDKDE